MKVKQLDLMDEIKKCEKAENPYRNGLGDLLPWEEPDYVKAQTGPNVRKNFEPEKYI